MPSPFPGMDPYLENPELWSEVHNRLIVAIADDLVTQISNRYRVAIEKRTYLSEVEDSLLVGIPDVSIVSQSNGERQSLASAAIALTDEPVTVTIPMVEEVRESYLEIRETRTAAVIAVVELLSPKNKRAGTGREAYERKRQQVLASITHLVEIDLLRGGQPLPILEERKSDYRILISRSDRRPKAHLYAFNVQQEIPRFPLPLAQGDVEPVVDLQTLLGGVYDRARYYMAVDYTQPAIPSLSKENAAWADALLREKGYRSNQA